MIGLWIAAWLAAHGASCCGWACYCNEYTTGVSRTDSDGDGNLDLGFIRQRERERERCAAAQRDAADFATQLDRMEALYRECAERLTRCEATRPGGE